jgi:integrase
MPDTRFLERVSGDKWRVVVNVPKSLQLALGKTKLKRSLETDSLTEANRLKWAVVAELRAELEAAKTPSRASGDAAVYKSLASEYRDRLARLPPDGAEALALREEIALAAESILGNKAYVERDEDGEEEIAHPSDRVAIASEFASVALATATPLRDGLNKFHAEGLWNNRTKADSSRALGYLEDWCRRQGFPQTVEAINRRRAGLFVSDMAAGVDRPDKRTKGKTAAKAKLAPRTINKYITCLSRYWGWMEKRGYLPENANVWERQSLQEAESEEDKKPREFTSDELVKLFTGEPLQPYMKPLMMIAALTGARIGAIIELRVKDISNGCFIFRPQKQEKSSRAVPIHSALVPVVAKLVEGRKQDEDLFPECPHLEADDIRERSMPAVKAFGRYRKSVGVDDKVEGQQRGRVNFHSFRKWFITMAFQAGHTEPLIQAVVGHKPKGVTLKHYHGGFTLEQLRACVESVKLPTETTGT